MALLVRLMDAGTSCLGCRVQAKVLQLEMQDSNVLLAMSACY